MMSKNSKELSVDSQGIKKSMTKSQIMGDAVTQFTLNTISGLIGMLTYFYTDIIGLAAATAGTILFISKIVDAFTDIIMGRIVDKTNTKYGKARPWLLWMIIPTFLAIVLLFTVPSKASNTVKIIYALSTNIFATAVVYTAIAIPYGCLLHLSTKSIDERTSMGVARAVLGYVSGMVIAIGLVPITNMLGGNQRSWILVSAIFGLISACFLFWTFKVSKEQNSDLSNTSVTGNIDSDVSLKESINILFKNKYWVIMFFVMILVNIIYALEGATTVYFAKYILGNPNLVALLGAVGLIPVIIGFSITQPMVKKFGLTKTVRIALIIGVIGTLIRSIAPYSLMLNLICLPFTTFATIPLMAVGGVLVNNTIEYNEWKFGKKLVGMSNSVSSFGAKMGVGLGSAMIGWILALGNYDGTLSVQPTSAITSILALSIWIPALILFIIFILLRHYDLDEKYQDIVADLNARKKRD